MNINIISMNNKKKDIKRVMECPSQLVTSCGLGHCAILPGVSIVDNFIVASGSIVTKDVPAITIVAGNPAKVLKHITE